MSDGIGGQGKAGIPLTKVVEGKIQQAKSGLTLALDGMKRLQERLSFGEYRGKKKRNFRNEGFQPTEKSAEYEQQNSIPKNFWWKLPQHFCVDCGRNDIADNTPEGTAKSKPSPGIVVMNDSCPELDMKFGDGIVYFICPACSERQMREQEADDENESDSLLLNQYGKPISDEPDLISPDGYSFAEAKRIDALEALMQAREDRMRKNTFDWIIAAKLRGDAPRQYQGV